MRVGGRDGLAGLDAGDIYRANGVRVCGTRCGGVVVGEWRGGESGGGG